MLNHFCSFLVLKIRYFGTTEGSNRVNDRNGVHEVCYLRDGIIYYNLHFVLVTIVHIMECANEFCLIFL